MNEPRVIKGHLKIKANETDYKPQRLRPCDLHFELDGIDIGPRLASLKLDFESGVIMAEIRIYVTNVDIDLPSLEVLTRAAGRDELSLAGMTTRDKVSQGH